MSGRTGIVWTDYSWNPVVGCTKVSQGCKLCYAKTVHDMRHAAHQAGKKVAPQYAHPFEAVQLKSERLGWPLSLQKPSLIFVNSVSDLFHEDVSTEFIDRVFAVMAAAPRHTFQILTKRPERMLTYLGGHWRLESIYDAWNDVVGTPREARGWPLPNVWAGISAENQEEYDRRWYSLRDTPAAVRWISAEPLLGPINCRLNEDERPDWIVVGGESGSSKQKPRPMHPDWPRAIRSQCQAAGIPFLFKQWGDWIHSDDPRYARLLHADRQPEQQTIGGEWFFRVGTRRAGRVLDGRTWDEYPATVGSEANSYGVRCHSCGEWETACRCPAEVAP